MKWLAILWRDIRVGAAVVWTICILVVMFFVSVLFQVRSKVAVDHYKGQRLGLRLTVGVTLLKVCAVLVVLVSTILFVDMDENDGDNAYARISQPVGVVLQVLSDRLVFLS
ncbi:hypothetical protein [Candidatus Poriferisocius sp.]|uniref:hypothetical protein n=1 Tax=Candidatus Poriferisocius sp. TaxID=3101276 RepID=UPI003B0103F5